MEHIKFWFRARKTPAGIKTEGTHQYSCGHKIDSGAGRPSDGIFAEWEWDGRKLVARNDRYGMFPLFYCAEDNQITVATSVIKLLVEGVPTERDDQAICAFLRLGFFIREDTHFKHIRLLPPNGTLEWEDGRLSVTGHMFKPKFQEGTRKQIIEGYIARFANAISRRLPQSNHVVVPLSGGRDSRHILLELHKQGVSPRYCVTINKDDEADIAARLAAAVATPHRTVSFDGLWFRHELRKNVATHFAVAETVEFMCMLDMLRRDGIDTLYEGIVGDVLSAGHCVDATRLRLFREGDWEELALNFFKYFGNDEESLKWFLTPDEMRRYPRDAAIAYVADECRRHADAPNPVGAFFFWNRSRRSAGNSPYGIFADLPFVYTPFLDHEVFDYLASFPAEYYLDNTVHTETIKTAYPEYADIPYSSVSRSFKISPLRRMLNLWEQTAFILRQAPGRLRTLGGSLAMRALSKSRIRASIPQIMIQADIIATPDGARRVLAQAESYEELCGSSQQKEIAKE